MQTSRLDEVIAYVESNPSCRVAAVCGSMSMWSGVVLDVCDKVPDTKLERNLSLRCGENQWIVPITTIRQTECQRFHAMWIVGYPPGCLIDSVRTRLVDLELS